MILMYLYSQPNWPLVSSSGNEGPLWSFYGHCALLYQHHEDNHVENLIWKCWISPQRLSFGWEQVQRVSLHYTNGEWYKILHKVKDWCSLQSPNAKSCTIARINTNRHLCCTTPRMLTKLNKIDKNLVAWMIQISFFFFLLGKYSQCATNA